MSCDIYAIKGGNLVMQLATLPPTTARLGGHQDNKTTPTYDPENGGYNYPGSRASWAEDIALTSFSAMTWETPAHRPLRILIVVHNRYWSEPL
jgi:hypothetical protein